MNLGAMECGVDFKISVARDQVREKASLLTGDSNRKGLEG
jgi:hypothetical protein